MWIESAVADVAVLTVSVRPVTSVLCSTFHPVCFCTFRKKTLRGVSWMGPSGLSADDGWIMFNRRWSSSVLDGGELRPKWPVWFFTVFRKLRPNKFMKDCGSCVQEFPPILITTCFRKSLHASDLLMALFLSVDAEEIAPRWQSQIFLSFVGLFAVWACCS